MFAALATLHCTTRCPSQPPPFVIHATPSLMVSPSSRLPTSLSCQDAPQQSITPISPPLSLEKSHLALVCSYPSLTLLYLCFDFSLTSNLTAAFPRSVPPVSFPHLPSISLLSYFLPLLYSGWLAHRYRLLLYINNSFPANTVVPCLLIYPFTLCVNPV